MDREVPEMPGFLVSPEITEALKYEVSRILHTRKSEFPGSQPVSFERQHIVNSLMMHDYFVCEKSDGLRCLLLLLVNKETGEEGCFLINRENEYYMVPDFHFPVDSTDFNQPHDGTILDGELVISKNPTTGVKELRYLIFDCLAYNRERMMQKILTKRLYYASEKFHKPFQKLRQMMPHECSRFPFKIDFKNMSQSFKVSKVFKEMHNLTYVTDGLIFTCCETPYIPGSDNSLFKWKPAEENTIDFKIRLEIPVYIDEDIEDHHDPDRSYPNYDTKPIFQLWMWEGGDDTSEVYENMDPYEYKTSFDNYVQFAELHVTDEEFEKFKALKEPLNGRVLETRRDENGNWRFLRFRDDKMNGNHSSVVKKILNSILDSVKLEELIVAAPKILENWNIREHQRKHHEQKKMEAMKNLHKLKTVVDEKGIAFKPPEGLLDEYKRNGHDEKSQGVSFRPPSLDDRNGHEEKNQGVSFKPPADLDHHQEGDDDYESDDFDDIPTYEKSVSPRYGDSEQESKRRKI